MAELAGFIDFIRYRTTRDDFYLLYEAYINELAKKNAPTIFEFTHLSELLGIESHALGGMVASTESFYRHYTIPKRRGGERIISSPYPSLLSAQKWINENVLSVFQLNESAHGFVKGRSIVTNAEVHKANRSLLKLDIQEFFPSIKFPRVFSIFRSLGYSDKVSYFLSRLCCLGECLPQGASTSPALSNIVARRLDLRLRKLAEKNSLCYTRYADDLTFSGEDISTGIVSALRYIIEAEGFVVNPLKTILSPGVS